MPNAPFLSQSRTVADINNGDAFARITAEAFPTETLALLKRWRKRADEAYVASEGRAKLREKLVERRQNAQMFLARWNRTKQDEPGWDADSEAHLVAAQAALDEAAEALNEHNAVNNSPPRKLSRAETARFTRNAAFAPEFGEFLMRQVSPGQTFRHVAVELPALKKGESYIETHGRLIASLEMVLDDLLALDRAPLPTEDAVARARAEVEAMAEEATPHVAQLFRPDRTGKIGWPSSAIMENPDLGEIRAQSGISMLCALFPQQMTKYIEGLVREQAANFQNPPLAAWERAKRLAEGDAKIMALHRQLAAVEEEMRVGRVEFTPTNYRLHPYAILMVEPGEKRLPKQDGSGSLVQVGMDRPAIASRS